MPAKLIIIPVLVGVLSGCANTGSKFPPINHQMKGAEWLMVRTPAAQPAAAKAIKNVEITINGVAGFQDTPMQPDGKWHVHDPARPQSPMVTPGNSFSENAAPPADATVLFDGKDVSHWHDKKTGGDPAWKVEDGVMVSAKG